MGKTFANSRSIIHSKDGLKHTAAPPDVCKTPSPGGPVPIPYVNIASDSDLSDGAKKVEIGGGKVALESSKLSTSMGDEPGTAGGGLLSSKTKGKMAWATKSSDVVCEGKGVVRFMDVTQHNGNSFNDLFIARGGTGLAYGDDFSGPCKICDGSPESHEILEMPSVAKICSQIIRKLLTSRHPDGFMVGVAYCRNCKKTIAATSGKDVSAGFSGIAGEFVDDVVSMPQVRDAGVFVKNNSFLREDLAKQKLFKRAWKSNKQSFGAQSKGGQFSKPGNCAAQKIVAAGHKPLSMSEMMYSPPQYDRWRKVYDLKSTVNGKTHVVPSFNAAAGFFEEPHSVASCKTCQELLPMMICDKSKSC